MSLAFFPWVKPLARAIGATSLLALSALAWQLGYTYTDWALVALLPLFAFLFLAAYPLHLAAWQGRLHVVLRPESSWAPWLRGRVRAAWRAASFAALAVVVVAWQSLVIPGTQIALYLSLILAAAAIHGLCLARTRRQLHSPYAQWTAMVLATWLTTLPFLLIAAYLTWSRQTYPELLLNASFTDTLQYSLRALPRQDGWIAEILAGLYAYDAAKLWLVLRFPDANCLAILYCLEAALVGFVLARSSTLLIQLWDPLHATRHAVPAQHEFRTG